MTGGEPVRVDVSGELPTVSGRELHRALEVKTAYKDWFPRMADYGFLEGRDFRSILSESSGGRPAVDHALSLAMAKEIAMLQRTEKGKEVRQYFLQIEEAWNRPEMVMARGLQAANRMLEVKAAEIKALESENAALKPKAAFADSVSASEECILVRTLAKNISQNGVALGEKKLFEVLHRQKLLGRDGGHPHVPTKKAVDMGLLVCVETTISSGGKTTLSISPKVTGKGQVYITRKFLSGEWKE